MTSLSAVSADELRSLIADDVPVLVDFRADWCVQCGPQENVLERVAPSYENVTFVSVDVGVERSVADDYGVITLPALLLFNRGKRHSTLVGFSKAPVVRDALDRLIAIE